MNRDRLIRVAAAPQAATPGSRDTDRWISWAAATTVAGLAGIAGALSYSHMRQLAADHGQAGWHAHAFPLSVDGIEIVASLVLLANRRAGRRPGTLPWAALIIGTVGSLAANVATAGPGAVSRIIAGWPALALLIAVKLLSGMLGQHTGSRLATVPSRPADDQNNSEPSSAAAVPMPSRGPSRPPPQTTVVLPARRGDTATHEVEPAVGTEPGAIPDLVAIADLLPAARAARDELHHGGQRLTRDALGARLRENGHPVRNSRLTPLLQTLRTETTTPRPARPADKAA